MSLFKNRSFNVKIVKDTDYENLVENPNNIETAQAYAEIVKDVAGDLATMAITLMVVKGACDVARIFAQALVK
jgi:hypothetical protein